MDERRSFLKDLASRYADAWGGARDSSVFQGEGRVETRNTIYRVRDGVCVAVTRGGRQDRGGAGASTPDSAAHADPTALIGMRLVGWLAHEDPTAGLTETWRPGAYAVLWRQRAPYETHSSVALTSATVSYESKVPPPRIVSRAQAPSAVASTPMRKSVPPPLPPRASAHRRQPLAKLPTSPLPPWAPSTLTRANIPMAPETPTPVRGPAMRGIAPRPVPRSPSSASYVAV